MSIQVLPSSGSLGTQLGAGFGKGLSEQLPKGIERGRLSATLKNLEGKSLSPLQQASQLVGAGGATPEQLATLMPFLRQAQSQKILEQQARGNQPPPGIPSAQATSVQTNQNIPQGFATPEKIQEMKANRLQPIDTRQIAQKALQIGGDPDLAKQTAKEQLETDLKTQKQVISDLQQDINDRYEDIFQSGDFKQFKSPLSGKTLQYFKDQGEYLVRNGMSTQEASYITGQKMRELGDAMLRAHQEASKFTLASGSDAKMAGILPERDIAKSMNQTDQFDKVIISELGVSPSTYFERTNPINDEKLIREISKTAKHSNKLEYFKKHVIPRIKATDNPQAILGELQKQRKKLHNFPRDLTPFLKAMKDAEKSGNLRLDEENKRVLYDFTTGTPTLSDVWFEMR